MEEKNWFETMDGSPQNDWFAERSYFSSPIWFENAAGFLDVVKKVCNDCINIEKKQASKKIKSKNDFGYIYQSGGLEKISDLSQFVEYVGKRSWDFLDNQGFDLTNHNLIFKDMWYQEFPKEGGGVQESHAHPNIHVSGFYFIESNDKSTRPVFTDPRAGALMTKLPMKETKDICHASTNINFIPQPGTLMLFNGYLPHAFPLVSGKEPFKFIHFNLQAVPQGAINVV